MPGGYDQPLCILPFDHRDTFETKIFGWEGDLTPEQTAEIAAAKQVIYDGFKAAIAAEVPKAKAGILVDEQFGSAIRRDAVANGYAIACPAQKSGQDEFDFEYGAEGHPLRRHRNQRRRLGARARLLHDAGRRDRDGPPPRSDLRHASARHGQRRPHRGRADRGSGAGEIRRPHFRFRRRALDDQGGDK